MDGLQKTDAARGVPLSCVTNHKRTGCRAGSVSDEEPWIAHCSTGVAPYWLLATEALNATVAVHAPDEDDEPKPSWATGLNDMLDDPGIEEGEDAEAGEKQFALELTAGRLTDTVETVRGSTFGYCEVLVSSRTTRERRSYLEGREGMTTHHKWRVVEVVRDRRLDVLRRNQFSSINGCKESEHSPQQPL
jgi:hypothetical protein